MLTLAYEVAVAVMAFPLAFAWALLALRNIEPELRRLFMGSGHPTGSDDDATSGSPKALPPAASAVPVIKPANGAAPELAGDIGSGGEGATATAEPALAPAGQADQSRVTGAVVPDALCCPITTELMVDPVSTARIAPLATSQLFSTHPRAPFG